MLTCEEFSDGLVLPPGGADEKQPGRQELVVAGQELRNGPGGAGGGPLLPLPKLEAFIDGVHQQEEGLRRGFNTQERQEDTSEEQREGEKERKKGRFNIFSCLFLYSMTSSRIFPKTDGTNLKVLKKCTCFLEAG